MPKQTDKELGLFFKNARHEQKLTYEELAEKAEMSSRYLKEIENGGRVPSFHKIRKLVRALNVPPEPLFYPNNHTDNLDYQRLLMYLSKCNDEQITAKVPPCFWNHAPLLQAALLHFLIPYLPEYPVRDTRHPVPLLPC